MAPEVTRRRIFSHLRAYRNFSALRKTCMCAELAIREINSQVINTGSKPNPELKKIEALSCGLETILKLL